MSEPTNEELRSIAEVIVAGGDGTAHSYTQLFFNARHLARALLSRLDRELTREDVRKTYDSLIERLKVPTYDGSFDPPSPDPLHAAAARAIEELVVGLDSQIEISNQLRESLQSLEVSRLDREAEAERRLKVAREAIEKAPHAKRCAFLNRFVHMEPCPFWNQQYCLVDDQCVHGLPMGEHCPQCEIENGKLAKPQLVFPEGAERCHPAPCDCWKSKALAGIAPAAPEGEKP